ERLSRQIPDVREAPSRDTEFVVQSILASVLDDPRRARTFRAGVGVLGLDDEVQQQLSKNLGRSAAHVSRFDLFTMPESVLSAATGRSGADLIRLRLEAAGLPTRPPAASSSSDSNRQRAPKTRPSR